MTTKALYKAAQEKKSVTGLPWGHSPAAMVLNMNFHCVMNYLPKLKIYKPKKK